MIANSCQLLCTLLVYQDDDDASGSQEGSSGGRSHLVEQFTGVGIKVLLSFPAIISMENVQN